MVKLNLGCGKRNFGKDWIHIDGGDFPHLHSHNITSLPFKDNSVDLIYSSHVLEYFDRLEVLSVLIEWRRVLKKGGILRIAVPDFESMSKLYTEGRIELQEILGPLYGKWEMKGKTIYHKTVYDFTSLSNLLSNEKFSDIRRYDWWDTEHADLDDHSQAYLDPKGDKEYGVLISLNVECVK